MSTPEIILLLKLLVKIVEQKPEWLDEEGDPETAQRLLNELTGRTIGPMSPKKRRS